MNWRRKQRGALDVLTGFICVQVAAEAFHRANNFHDPWIANPALDEGKPLYDLETGEEVWGPRDPDS